MTAYVSNNSLASVYLHHKREKAELTDEAHRIIKVIKQMEASLDDRATDDQYQHEDNDLKVTVPLMRCLQTLKEKHNTVAKIHRERYEQVKSEPYSEVSRPALNFYRIGTSS